MTRVSFLCLFFLLLITGCDTQEQLPTYTITGEELNGVDDRLFSGFFEKATWSGEIGSDAAISLTTGEVLPEVKKYMEWMNIPILRFPGGTAIDYYPWYNLIDYMPGKHTSRPPNIHWRNPAREDAISSDGRMGLHEFISLCKELDIEPLLVTNLGDAYYGKLPVETAAEELGANLVAYCNDTEGKWAELRAKNGSAEPFDVTYFQIGNETWLFDGFKKAERTGEELEHYTDCVVAYVNAMKEADPDIKLIIDGDTGVSQKVMEQVGDKIAFNVFHSYSPWGIYEIKMGEDSVDAAAVDPALIWQAIAAAPRVDSATGLSAIRNSTLDNVRPPIAMTEWNLNTWFTEAAIPARPENEFLCYGIGAGSYLNAILRVSDKVKMANQSMLVGTGWGITSIRVDTTEQVRPQTYPTGMVTGLYSRYHGDKLIGMTSENMYTYEQPLSINWLKASPKVAEQDVVVTGDNEHYYLHIVNRSFDKERRLRFLFPEAIQSEYTHYLLSDRTEGEMSEFAAIEELQQAGADRETIITIPPKSVSVVVMRK